MTQKIWLLAVFFLACSGTGRAAETLRLDLARVIQNDFLGVNAVYHAFGYLPESREEGMGQEFRKVELARLETAGLHMARTFYRPDWAMGSGPWTTADWESERMRALYAWLKEMQERRIEVALNMGWWFGRDVTWNQDQHLPAYPGDLQAYVAWVSESLHQIVEVRGFRNVKYLVMFTEPEGGYGNIPHGKSSWDYYKEVVTATHLRLTADGRRSLVKLVGPNTTRAPVWLAETVRELDQAIDIYSSHDYNFETYDDWHDLALKIRQAVQATGKPFWVDEYGIQDSARRESADYGNILAQANAAFMNAGAQNSLLWILADQYYPAPLKFLSNGDSFEDGKHRWGLWPWPPEGGAPRPAWYAFALMSRLLGGAGGKVLQTVSPKGLPFAAVTRADGQLSLLLVNGERQEREVRIELAPGQKEARTIYRYLYDPAAVPAFRGEGLIASDRRLSLAEGYLSDRIPPRGVAIYSTLAVAGPKVAPSVAAGKGGRGNLAHGRKVTASSSDPRWPPENLTDSKRLSFWSSRLGKGSRAEWVEVDLAAESPLRQVDLYPRYEAGVPAGAGFPAAFRIELSRDRKQWQTVLRRQGYHPAAAGVQSFRFPSSTARYIRLRVDQLAPLGKDGRFALQLGEFKVYGD